jgi:hypothetical protein
VLRGQTGLSNGALPVVALIERQFITMLHFTKLRLKSRKPTGRGKVFGAAFVRYSLNQRRAAGESYQPL